jgi:hypothetical protein
MSELITLVSIGLVLVGLATRPAYHHPEQGAQAMAHPTYVIDIVALTLAAALAAAVVLIGFHLMHELADLMPPALSGAH